jgi:hypothetical protein
MSPEEFWEMRSQISDVLRQKLSALAEDEQSEIAAEIIQAASKYFFDGKMKFPSQMIIVTGRKGSN